MSGGRPARISRTKTILLSVLANLHISSPIPHASQGHSPVRLHTTTYNWAAPGHQQAARQATGLEAITSDESDDDRRSWFKEVVVGQWRWLRVDDVLVAVYRALRDWVFERHGEFGVERSIERGN